MKRTVVPILFLINLAIILFVIFTNASENSINYDDIIRLGEEKYLKFLWMVDGAFNSDKMNDDFTVNGKALSTDDKIFTCKYKKNNSNVCVGNNFEKEFANLFAKTITYEDVYSDGEMYSVISYENKEYVFNIVNNCGMNRMNINQKIRVIDISDNKIVYEISSDNMGPDIMSKRDFILIRENNNWVISKAFYHDLCGMKYYIG